MSLSTLQRRAWWWQSVLLLAVLAALILVIHTTAANLRDRGIITGLDFLSRPALFPISQTWLTYTPTDSFARALLVGALNTIFLSVITIVGATLAGVGIAMARGSRHPVANALAVGYVEALRNTPLVVQLLFWYALLTFGLPAPHAALQPLPGVFLTNRGLYLPLPLLECCQHGARLLWSRPVLGRFNFSGGLCITPEFTAVVAGLVAYSAAYVGEIVRGGIDAVPGGQWEAGRALGLSERQTLRQVIAPQALRVIVPPLSSQYINIIKNTTLALVVGYPDLSFVVATTINQTGQALEGVGLLMSGFLALSLGASWIANWLNRRILERGR